MSNVKKTYLVVSIFYFIVNIKASDDILHRDKRYLILNRGGIIKAVLGFAMPVEFNDDSKRSLVSGYNFQSQYALPPALINPFTAPIFTGASRKSRSENEADDSRQILYSIIESIWDKRGRPGQECVSKIICEVAQNPLAHNGILGQIIDQVFTPGDDFADNHEYHDARIAGQRGINCDKLYSKCERGMGFLDSVLYFN